MKQNITIYYEEPQEDVIKSKEGATPTLKILSAVSNVDEEAVKAAVNNSVHEVFERKQIKVNKIEHEHEHHEHEHHEHEHHEHEHHEKHKHGDQEEEISE
ncbi:hypothetical protein [Methanosarcina barkeri]|uniref:hypothetical protein n=1 Tax=Methanosarcina barkeri TaxID=2208 RepID=UPI000B0573C0|nr:hypothetical protein [Methanosarcina barkeri]